MLPFLLTFSTPALLLRAVAAALVAGEQHRRSQSPMSPPPLPANHIDPRWRTSDVIGVARGIDADQAFERLPILADALMDAGCEDEQILGHCRGHGPYVRGCWVVDLVLRKE